MSKQVYIIHTVRGKLDEDTIDVEEFDVTYDQRGVLTVRSIRDSTFVEAHYGPGIWLYYAFLEDEDEQEEKEEST